MSVRAGLNPLLLGVAGYLEVRFLLEDRLVPERWCSFQPLLDHVTP